MSDRPDVEMGGMETFETHFNCSPFDRFPALSFESANLRNWTFYFLTNPTPIDLPPLDDDMSFTERLEVMTKKQIMLSNMIDFLSNNVTLTELMNQPKLQSLYQRKKWELLGRLAWLKHQILKLKEEGERMDQMDVMDWTTDDSSLEPEEPEFEVSEVEQTELADWLYEADGEDEDL
ncbi:hypothetical protein NM208_g3463 [Fusarium decemcellulare]|uniref:Uncharacterized protein n=1 Tax=Fusarium decemcellulare TaxID=57161 RepID=A0ACC1SP65_9HYPO|nr:hypothetical protein NM208_g3463 [Fusarium decemcellulare]